MGWQIVEERYRAAGGEIDLIARDGDTVVFVEVKTRQDERRMSPAEAVDAAKRRRIAAAAEAYSAEHLSPQTPCRFDVAEVRVGRDGLSTVRLIRDAFLANE
jgi:putative endonuclease